MGKNELKFAGAGKGKNLHNNQTSNQTSSSSTSNRRQQQPQQYISKPTSQNAAQAQNHARLAALQRQESRDAQNKPKNYTQESVRRRAAAELARERQLMEEEMSQNLSNITLPPPTSDLPVHMNKTLA